MADKPITLGINTTTRDCSVALLVEDKTFVASEYSERGHEGIVLNLMDRIFQESGVNKNEVEVLAFGRGPGAFTGIRVATAMTQGLAVGLGIPVVPVSDLLNIAHQHFLATGKTSIASCVDARMQEIYSAVIDCSSTGYRYIQNEALLSPSNWQYDSDALLCGVGNGFEMFPDLVDQLNIDPQNSDFSLVPTGLAAAQIGRSEFIKGNAVEAAEALPVYLRNEVAWK